MSSYIDGMDKIYKERKKSIQEKFPRYVLDEDYRIVEEIKTADLPLTNSFKVVKKRDSSICMFRNRGDRTAELYLSDLDIIKAIIQIFHVNQHAHKHLVMGLRKLINGKSEEVMFLLSDTAYSIEGFGFYKEVIFTTEQDINISVNDLIFLICLIIEKEKKNKKKYNGRSTVYKYLLFSEILSERNCRIAGKRKKILEKLGIQRDTTNDDLMAMINIRSKKELIFNPDDFKSFL